MPFNEITIIEISYYAQYLDRYDVLIGHDTEFNVKLTPKKLEMQHYNAWKDIT